MTPAERDRFERDGYLIVPSVLSAAETARYRSAVQRTYDASPAAATRDALHLLSAVTHCPELVTLVDHPATFGLIWSLLGWNVHVYHSHIDVHPTVADGAPFRWRWHQDGGRQNRELEGDPRPRLSVKVAYWLSDVSVPGRGNLMVVPGSHTVNRLPGPPDPSVEWPQPDGAIELLLSPGDALVMDRRLWHARSDNRSDVTRAVVFFGYSYRWITMRDVVAGLPEQPWFAQLSAVQRQLLGHVDDDSGDHAWGLVPDAVPVHAALRERGIDPRSLPALP